MPPRHLPVLDGLRAVAVLLVLWCHVPSGIPDYPAWLGVAHWLVGPGGLGVEIFFVLSGFLITRILLAERERAAPVRWFLLRRMLRIFPIYYLLLLILLPFRPLDELGWCAVYLANLRSITSSMSGPLEHTWSLCIEEHFYLLWPLVVAFAPLRWARRTLSWFVIPGAVVGAVVVGQLVTNDGGALTIVAHGSPFRFASLGAGCLVAFAEPWFTAAPRRLLRLGLALLGAAMLIHPHLVLLLGPTWSGTGEWVPRTYAPVIGLVHSAVLGTGILLVTLHAQATRRSPLRALAWSPLRAIGRISYALYLYHLPIYYVTVRVHPTPAWAALAIALTFAAATVSYFAIERPILRVGDRFRATTRTTPQRSRLPAPQPSPTR